MASLEGLLWWSRFAKNAGRVVQMSKQLARTGNKRAAFWVNWARAVELDMCAWSCSYLRRGCLNEHHMCLNEHSIRTLGFQPCMNSQSEELEEWSLWWFLRRGLEDQNQCAVKCEHLMFMISKRSSKSRVRRESHAKDFIFLDLLILFLGHSNEVIWRISGCSNDSAVFKVFFFE